MDFFDLHSLLPTILLAICTYLLKAIHKDFQDMKVDISSQKVQWAMIETKLTNTIDRVNKLEDRQTQLTENNGK